MNQRISIKCDTCFNGIVLRVGVGTQKKQIISIPCPNCKQKISLELVMNSKKTQLENIHKLKNCTFADELDDFIAINLHTELIYPKYALHEKIFMPAMFVEQKLIQHAVDKGLYSFNKSIKRKSNTSGPLVMSVFDGLSGDSELEEDWKVIYKAYSLYEHKQKELMEKELNNYTKVGDVYKQDDLLNSVIFDFLSRFIAPNDLIYKKIKQKFNYAKKKKDKYKEFKNYYNSELQNINWKNYIDIFNEYFKNFSEYNRLLLNAKIELHPEKGTESVFCPVNFNDVKMFYGNAFEYLTSNIISFACINNILNNRTYDQFESMMLHKFLHDLTKSSKLNPLKKDVVFNEFIDNIDSSIRNASHHKWFYIDDNNPEYLLYRSGGTGAVQKISYIDYIYKSNILILKIAVMAMIEIKFLYKK